MEDLKVSLNPQIPGSFSYKTYTERWPITLTNLIDSLCRNRDDILRRFSFLANIGDQLKLCIRELSRLRHEISTDKPLFLLEDATNLDTHIWNEILATQLNCRHKSTEDPECYEADFQHNPTRWFSTTFLFAETYMYRRVFEIFWKNQLFTFDYFQYIKAESATRPYSLGLMKRLSNHFITQQQRQQKECHNGVNGDANTRIATLRTRFEHYVKMSLCGNENDLAFSAGGIASNGVDGGSIDQSQQNSDASSDWLAGLVQSFDDCILCDDTEIMWRFLIGGETAGSTAHSPPPRFILVLDNAGLELFSDLMLAEFLLEARLVSHCHLYFKAFPWYVSDALQSDLTNLLDSLLANQKQDKQNNEACVTQFVRTIQQRIGKNELELCTHHFFTLPHAYHALHTQCPDLYQQLCGSESRSDSAKITAERTLIVFKGDLNYRKLLADRTTWWQPNPACVQYAENTFAKCVRDIFSSTYPSPCSVDNEATAATTTSPKIMIASLRFLKCDVCLGACEMNEERLERAKASGSNWMTTGKWATIHAASI